jgi:hypothetical protein
VEAIPCHLYLTERISLSGLNTMAAGGFVLVVLLTAVTTVVPLALGVKAIRRMEV